MRPLTALMKRFCNEYIKDENGRQAAIRAGYSEKAACQQAGQLLQDKRIQDLIVKLPGYNMSIDDMSPSGHLRKISVLRDKLEDAGDNPEITTPQVSALRGAVDAEVARGRALRFHEPDPQDPKEDDDAPTMGEIMRGRLRPDSRKEVEPQTNGSGEDS